MDLSPWLCLLNLLMIWKVSLGLDRELSCAVCRALVDEVNDNIRKVDPKKTIQVGSFRVDSKGNQKTYEKPYARSEVHLIEVFESVCDNFKDYAEVSNSAGGRSVGRTKARNGRSLALKDIKINAQIQKDLKHNCEYLIEEFEEDMVAMFRRDNQPEIDKVICVDIASVCSVKDMAIPMPITEILPEEIMSHVKEANESDDEDKEEDGYDDDETEEKIPDIEEELLKLYEKDNQDSVAADTVMNLSGEGKSQDEQQKEEL